MDFSNTSTCKRFKPVNFTISGVIYRKPIYAYRRNYLIAGCLLNPII